MIMEKYRQLAFLCGYFNIPGKKEGLGSLPENWRRISFDSETMYEYKKFFYNEFVDFFMKDDASCSVQTFRYDIHQTIPVLYNGMKCNVIIDNITAYVLPYNMLIYSIEIENRTDSLDIITGVTSVLRSVMSYNEKDNEEFMEFVISPIQGLFSFFNNSDTKPDYSSLVENGNKLKVFQIVNSEILLDKTDSDKDILLFELGTLSKVGLYEKHENNGISTEYFQNIISRNKISFYNNWSGLSLFDTFTILSEQAPSWMLDNWVNTYFRMIYIHGLFLKFFLFRLNDVFRSSPQHISRIEDELVTFEGKYCFHKISYNFLPLEIYKSVDKGLEISEERDQLYHLIEIENQRREKKNDKRVNRFLIFLTLFTMLSTLWDSSCLFNELYPYDIYVGSTIVGYKMVVSLLTLVIIFAVIIIFKKRK